MRWKEQFGEARRRFDLPSFYGKFEHIVIFILTVLIAVFALEPFPSARKESFFLGE